MCNEITKRACSAYTYYGEAGLERIELKHSSVVRDLENPEAFSSNRVFFVRAASQSDINLLFEELATVYSKISYRHFVIDPYTPENFVASLALRNYTEHSTTLQMVLKGNLKIQPSRLMLEFLSVETVADWEKFKKLISRQYTDNIAQKGVILNESVLEGIFRAYRLKSDACKFFIAELNGIACAYGSSLSCPNGMGMVEDLYTLPEYRNRGIAGATIMHCVQHCRTHGSDDILIGCNVKDTSKQLYHRLGFEPVCLTREYIGTA